MKEYGEGVCASIVHNGKWLIGVASIDVPQMPRISSISGVYKYDVETNWYNLFTSLSNISIGITATTLSEDHMLAMIGEVHGSVQIFHYKEGGYELN